VDLHRAFGDVEFAGDEFVALAQGNLFQDAAFLFGEAGLVRVFRAIVFAQGVGEQAGEAFGERDLAGGGFLEFSDQPA